MDRVAIDLADGLKDQACALAEAEGITWEQFADRAIYDAVTRPGAPEPEPLSQGVLEDMFADWVLAHVDPAHAQIVRRVCQEQRLRPIHLLFGHIVTALERGEHAVVNHAAVRRAQAGSPVAPLAALVPTRCAFCGGAFHPTAAGQLYCPDPAEGESCGRRAMLEVVHARRRHVDRQPDPVTSVPRASGQILQQILQQRRQAGRGLEG